ncbi:MAG: LacI family DNA-binding transcriptional regulator [Anaerolineaceae bacterium]
MRPDPSKETKPLGETHPTIYDVAKLAGVSISTVSRVINSPERVNEDTRARILAAIDELNFIPKAEARARALQGNHRIGILSPFYTTLSFVQRLRGIDAVLTKTNYEMLIYTVDSMNRLIGYLTSLAITGNLDGLIIISLPLSEAVARRLAERGPKIVTIEASQEIFYGVEIDDFYGGKLAANYLISKGHKSCAFIGDIDPPDYTIRPVIARLEGFKQGMTDAGLQLPDYFIRSSNFSQEPTRQAARELLSLPDPPTAIFVATDIQAIIVIKVANEMGIKIPDDLAIIGFDDLDIAEYVGLTTIRQPLDDSGRIAAELLLSQLNDARRPIQHVKLPLCVIERDTV